MNVRKAMLLFLGSCYLFLWLGGIGSQLLGGRTPADASWAAPGFLLLAGMLVLLVTERQAERVALLMVGVLGLAAEAIGVHSGVPFGRYEYTDALRPQITGVPLVMAAAWMVLVAYVKTMLALLRLPTWVEILVAGLWMVAIDLVIDPLAAGRLNYWRWADTGSYYGIPTGNFLGWFVVSLIIFGLLAWRPSASWQMTPGTLAIGLSIILFFTSIALAHHLSVAAGVGFALSLLHLAVLRQRRSAVRHKRRRPMKQQIES